jgi:hypothetical protein
VARVGVLRPLTPQDTLAYTLDHGDHIVDIRGPWDAFAVANGAPGLTRDRVIGTRLLAHVTGLGVGELTRMLLLRARRGPVRGLAFRCDAPDRRRYLRMSLEPLPGNGLRIETTLLRTEPRAPQRFLDTNVERSDDVIVACSWCRKIEVPGTGFVEVDDAVATQDLFAGETVPAISHGVCGPCADQMRSGPRVA